MITTRSAVTVGTVWAGIAGIVAVHQLVMNRLTGVSGPGALPSSYALLAMWALATPSILRSARRWPIRPDGGFAALAGHLWRGGLFIVGTNVLIRLPRLWLEPGGGLGDLALSSVRGVVTYGPYAMVVYGAIVILGHALRVGVPDRPAAGAPADPTGPEPTTSPGCLVVRENEIRRVIPLTEIRWVEADDNHVRIGLSGGTVRVRTRLAEVERRLVPGPFIRVHRSAIVAVDEIRSVVPRVHGDWTVELRSGREFPVARSRRKTLEATLGALGVGAGYSSPAGRYSATQ